MTRMQDNIFHRLAARSEKINFDACIGSFTSITLSQARSFDWLNGFYLHASGPRAAELLNSIRQVTYKFKPFRTEYITVSEGEQLCNAQGYETSVGRLPTFPHMEQTTGNFGIDNLEYDATTTCIALSANLYGSDIGPGIPVVALVWCPLQFEFNYGADIVGAVQAGELTLSLVVHEYGFCDKDIRAEHAVHRHTRQVLGKLFVINNGRVDAVFE